MRDGLLSIGEAAALLHRKVPAVRKWDRQGYVRVQGRKVKFSASRRDAVNGVRYFDKAFILRLRAAILLPVDAT